MQVRTFSARFSPGHAIEKHSHRWSQLLFASEGVLAVESQVACWIVPTHRAIWIPAGVEHALKMHGRTFLQTVYFESHFAILKPLACGAYEISPLMRELILYACSKGIIHGETEEDRNLIDFLAYQVCQLSPFPWKIPMPRDDRARRLAQRIIELPGTEESLRDLCQSIGSSLRTMQRVFSSELGYLFRVGETRSRWCMPFNGCRVAERLLKSPSISAMNRPALSSFLFANTSESRPGSIDLGRSMENVDRLRAWGHSSRCPLFTWCDPGQSSCMCL